MTFVYSRTKAGLYKYFMESGVIPMFQKTGKHANHAMKGGDTMKKLSALLLSIAMLMVCVVSVSAAPVESSASPAGFVGDLFDVTSQNKTEFYVQRFGAQMDENGQVSSRDEKYFTPVLYKNWLPYGLRKTDYSVVYQEGKVSSDDVIREVRVKPKDADILAKIKEIYVPQGGKVLSSNGEVVSWDMFDTDHYEMRWYVLKYEEPTWHVDGVIVEKETDLPIEIPLPGEPGYEEPEEPEENPGEAFEYTSNFAYIYGYSDTVMAPDNELLRSEVSAMVHRLVKQNNKLGGFVYDASAAPAFDDIAGEWFRSGIEYMNYKGAFAPGSNVYPYASVTRGETFKIICLGLGFSDKTDLSYDDYAAILYDAGYIQGDENGNLNIEKSITRAEFCTIYNKIIGRDSAGLLTADGTEITAETYGFTDLDENQWYYETMLKATSAYDDEGYVDIALRNQRNVLDDYQ